MTEEIYNLNKPKELLNSMLMTFDKILFCLSN